MQYASQPHVFAAGNTTYNVDMQQYFKRLSKDTAYCVPHPSNHPSMAGTIRFQVVVMAVLGVSLFCCEHEIGKYQWMIFGLI